MPKSILLVEDDESLRENIALILESEGYKVTAVIDGHSAVKEAENSKYDLILCDIMIPNFDGYEVLSRIRSITRKFPPPFIFLTAKTERQDMRKGMELGADDYITKPFTRNDILNSIDIQFHKREKLAGKQKAEKELIEELKNKIQEESIKTLRLEDKKQNLKYEENIFLSDQSKSDFIKISSIIYLTASKDYTKVYTKDNKTYTIRKSLKAWENRLPKEHFLRIHRSTIINAEYIEKVERWFNYSHRVQLKEVKNPFIISQRYSRKLRKSITKL